MLMAKCWSLKKTFKREYQIYIYFCLPSHFPPNALQEKLQKVYNGNS